MLESLGAAVMVLSVAMVLPPNSVEAQDTATEGICDRLRPVTSALGYRVREPQVRCEGLYESAVRAIGLELVGVQAGPSFDPSQGSVEIVGPELPQDAAGSVRIRAVALPLKAYYRMDGVLNETSRLAWPIEEVVRPAGLDPESIGLYGWIGTEMDKTFVPLRVTAAAETASGPDDIRLLLRVASDAESLFWRITEDGTETEWEPAAEGPVRGGQTVALTLPPGPPRVVQVDVTAKPVDSDQWTSLRFDVLRVTP